LIEDAEGQQRGCGKCKNDPENPLESRYANALGHSNFPIASNPYQEWIKDIKLLLHPK
jgi:hypothetical protein